MPTPVITPAVSRKFRVLWYEAKGARHILSGGVTRALPRPKAERKAVFEVEARTLDTARAKARDYVRRRGAQPLAVNFTQRTDELIVYTKEKH